MRSTKEIRQIFIDMLKEDGHKIIPSASLIPPKELGLLFTNAGMNQFAAYFSGDQTPFDTRLGSVQKCMRVSGKHNDFETVGFSPHHHTFFEMLGYFSFGDYFKEHAIELGWRYFHTLLGIPKERLFITVYKDDEESLKIWRDKIGIDEKRIYKMDKSNFWEMGETGPCGPSTEIIYDLIGNTNPTVEELNDSYNYLELGNIVFTQYYKNSDGKLDPLPKKNVDTGLGLERIARVVQETQTNFETDLFFPIIKELELKSGFKYDENPDLKPAFRIVADHIRALTFLIGDNITPSNVGRGYVVRKLLRRAAINLKKLSIEEFFLYKLVGTVNSLLGDAYPIINEKKELIERVIYEEERRFKELLKIGYGKYNKIVDEIKKNNGDIIDGNALFELYDTLGFPIDLIKAFALDDKLKLDLDGFNIRMAEQRERARKKQKRIDLSVVKEIPKTEFIGSDELRSDGNILLILNERFEKIDKLEKGQRGTIILDKSPFYAESGGQVGDRGKIIKNSSLFTVEDTKKENGIYLHIGIVKEGSFLKNEKIDSEVDPNRRKNIAVHHTLTHLLQAAIREVLGEHCHQAGSYVSEDILRFDFSHFKKVTDNEIKKIEDIVNNNIAKGLNVLITETTLNEAVKRGATALFEAKYGENVRLVEVEDASLELCGGTHLHNTLIARGFKITGEIAVAAGVRRIEAVGGERYIAFMNENYQRYKAIAFQLKTSDPQKEVEKLQENYMTMIKEKNTIEKAALEFFIKGNISNKILCIVRIPLYLNFNYTKDVMDEMRIKFPDKVILAYQVRDEKLVLAISRGSNVDLDAAAFMRPFFGTIKGGGGGRNEFIQCGGGNPSGVEAVIEKLGDVLNEK